jgi:ribonuclease T2
LLSATAPASAAGLAGVFDFYVLSLSWEPGYCVTDPSPDPAQCGRGRGFVVHGLWPEYEHGWPEYCSSRQARDLRPATLAAIADIMPSRDLADHQWDRHGLCSGLSPDAFFALMRSAAARVVLPDALAATPPRRMSPAAIEAAFTAANPGLTRGGLSVQCRSGTLTEVRVCLTRDLGFRPCEDVDEDSCRALSIAVAPP